MPSESAVTCTESCEVYLRPLDLRDSSLPASINTIAKMSTLADELLNDFGDNGSEDESEQQDGFLHGSASPPGPNGHQKVHGPENDMEEDDEDEEMLNGSNGVEDAQDEEETKAKVEKMQLGGVSDVRNVAGLMKTLEPVLEVLLPPLWLTPSPF